MIRINFVFFNDPDLLADFMPLDLVDPLVKDTDLGDVGDKLNPVYLEVYLPGCYFASLSFLFALLIVILLVSMFPYYH